ncbi:MAG: gamma-glutamyltransferase [Myxococcota bacterium]
MAVVAATACAPSAAVNASASSAPKAAAPSDTAHGGGDRLTGSPFTGRSAVYGANGMAATAQPLATQVAIDVLKKGGSAVDAAVAANAALGLMEPVGCGIGGDLFAIVWDPKTKRLYGYNGSGRSPMGRSLEALKAKLKDRKSIPPVGSLPVTVPGAVDGWFALHERFGKLPMQDVLQPAITYAEEGFPLTPVIAYYWQRNMRIFEKRLASGWLEELDNAKKTYLIDGQAPKTGQRFKNPDLAKTYRQLATGGRAAYYEGEIAQAIDKYMKRIGGDLTAADLAAHKGEWVDPVSVMYRGYEVFELPPNTQGIAALQMLQMLEPYDLAKMSEAERIHVMVEAKRLAFEDRAKFYADMATAKVPLKGLLDPQYAQARRKLIDLQRARASVTAGAPKLEDGDTTYLTVADSSGMMISLIQSNYRGLGSGLVADGLGFMLQDRGELFSLEADHANVYAPGKRPFHTIIPAFVLKDGRPWLSFGVMGGAMQPQGHVQVLVNVIDLGMDLQAAGDAARWRHDGSSEPTAAPVAGTGTLMVESGVSPAVVEDLRRRGHTVKVSKGGFGGYQAISRDEAGVYTGASEMRKDGNAQGY